MNQGAHVRSIEALSDLRSAIAVFEEEAGSAMSMAEADIVRTIDWIRADRLPYWKKEITRREEMLTRAKSDLARAQMTDHAMGPKSTVDERKAIARARQQVDEARQKMKASQRWFRELEKQYTLYKGRVAPMQRLVAAEMPKARHDLELMARTLDEYLSISNDGGAQEAGSSLVNASSVSVSAGEGSRRVWKDLAPSRRQRSRAALAGDVEETLHARAGAVRWAMVDESSTRRLAHLLGVDDAMEVQRFDPEQAARNLGAAAEPPPNEDKLIVAADWTPEVPTLLMRSVVAPLGDSGWVLVRSDATEAPEEVVAVRIGEAIEAYPELAIVLACPRGTALLLRDGEMTALHDERGYPLSSFGSGTLDEQDGTEFGQGDA